MDEKELVKQELYQAIAYFIERQQLVAQVMLYLGLDLDLVGRFGALAWDPGPSYAEKHFTGGQLNEADQALLKAIKRNEARQLTRRGNWGENQEWEYCLHGAGCLLTNKLTDEPIDWDCPNVMAFDDFFFRCHLGWQLKTADRKNKLKDTQRWIAQQGEEAISILIKEMVTERLIEKYPTLMGLKYTLTAAK